MGNELHKENSPYLQQHAENPVHWKAWNEDTLALARKENKPLLISVGYAACHWCHVMEKESFEDPQVAAVMNRYFINIKVDREERPDIDQLYMSAVQIMTGNGGWPMNVVALPDGRPFWGGTYFKKQQWLSTLKQLGELYHSDLPKVEEYAEKLTEGLQIVNMVPPAEDKSLPNATAISEAVAHWSTYMDPVYGGRKGAPKFMMPVNLNFLLQYATLTGDRETEDHFKTTLDHMLRGGIYDQLGGGFARYSTDERWHVPHFEMMLYDNAQLLTTYALAWRKYKDPDHLEAIHGIYNFITRELQGEKGEFYSSLDADSLNDEGKMEEGAYYTWTKAELEEILGDDFNLFARAYHIDARGHWEEGRYVLLKTSATEELMKDHGIDRARLNNTLEACKNKLLEVRKKRQSPGLDDKCLTSWNALTITGMTHAYLATGETKFLETALKNLAFIEQVMTQSDGGVIHNYRRGTRGTIEGFLEDYAFLIEAYINLYQAGCGDAYLLKARGFTNYVIDNFYDPENGMFRFTSIRTTQLVSTPIEKSDNVTPASNSAMAHNLFLLAALFGNTGYRNICDEMLRRMKGDLSAYAYSHANWLSLALRYTHPFYEVAISGSNAVQEARKLQTDYLPNVLVAPAEQPGNIPLLRDRHQSGKTLFYVCRDRQCNLPVNNLEACKAQLGPHSP
ncbi:thioredoxin domain-containing protein [Robertkochia sediminum]|uniref:thioredoxin domain-containing protein n=1 Tax=Robertkochia sediminum TaxID=2785326 RepID=UPI001932E053|nr:thioredoxin domain-containing protein [Robertkochia sediminum]MBL7472006.1 thioredoxin domain-containing protein [Robertkochia sediminum]